MAFSADGRRIVRRSYDKTVKVCDSGEPLVLERKVTVVRWAFVIGKDGMIAYKNTKVNPAKDSQQVLAFVKVNQSSQQRL